MSESDIYWNNTRYPIYLGCPTTLDSGDLKVVEILPGESIDVTVTGLAKREPKKEKKE
jgi:hypothetical protein